MEEVIKSLEKRGAEIYRRGYTHVVVQEIVPNELVMDAEFSSHTEWWFEWSGSASRGLFVMCMPPQFHCDTVGTRR
jgi:hypothetical protein